MTAANRTGYDLVSADSHVIEPGDLFETRLPKHLRGRAPKMVTSDGRSEWMVEDVGPVPLPGTAATGSGFRLPKRGATRTGISFDEVLPALYDPAARLMAQDADSIDASVGESILAPDGLCRLVTIANLVRGVIDAVTASRSMA